MSNMVKEIYNWFRGNVNGAETASDRHADSKTSGSTVAIAA